MARKPTDTTAIEDKATEDKAVTTPASEAQEQTTGARDAAPITQENAVPPVTAPEAGTARSASDQMSNDPDASTLQKNVQTVDYNAITVRGPKKGRWRAGRHFGAEPVIIPLDEVSQDMAQKLQGDPTLIITPHLIGPPVTGD